MELTQGQSLKLGYEDVILQARYGVEGDDRDVTELARTIAGSSGVLSVSE